MTGWVGREGRTTYYDSTSAGILQFLHKRKAGLEERATGQVARVITNKHWHTGVRWNDKVILTFIWVQHWSVTEVVLYIPNVLPIQRWFATLTNCSNIPNTRPLQKSQCLHLKFILTDIFLKQKLIRLPLLVSIQLNF